MIEFVDHVEISRGRF